MKSGFEPPTTNGKRRRIVIGKVAELKPNRAAQAASELKKETDPLDKVKEQRQAHVAAQMASAQRTLGNYLDGLYSKHQARKRSGHETLNMIRKNFAPRRHQGIDLAKPKSEF